MPRIAPSLPLLLLAALALALAGCGRESPRKLRAAPAQTYHPPRMVRTPVGEPVGNQPWIAHVNAVDLDRDGLVDVLACDAKGGRVGWIRQTARGVFAETLLADQIPGAVHVEAVDFDGDADLDLLVASMGIVFPNNDKIGSVVLLENDGAQRFTRHVLLEHVARVTEVRAADFNGDGRLDLAVAQFGYDQGEVRWMENLGGLKFRSTILLDLSGGINACVADMNGDGTKDIVTLISQNWEEIFLLANDGHGNFTAKAIFGSTNEDYGSSGITLCDLNRDGRPDVLYTNGDGFDYATPGPRPWHGAQWLENRGNGNFQFHRIGDLPGAYSPVEIDFDGDGFLDVVAVSGFNDWARPDAVSLMLFRNDGRMRFSAHPLAGVPTHLMCATAGDLDGNGRPVLITGGFHAYPPWGNQSRVSLWRPEPRP